MDNPATDAGPMHHIDKLVKEEHRLFELKSRTPQQDKKLKELQIQLDQCWDLLRQRRAARETGHNPDDAQLRPPGVVENYKG